MMRLAVPEKCRFCGITGFVVLRARTHGGGAARCWYCQRCDGIWPLSGSDQRGERRTGPSDRRARARADRRKHNDKEE
jgi:hypothetical protein